MNAYNMATQKNVLVGEIDAELESVIVTLLKLPYSLDPAAKTPEHQGCAIGSSIAEKAIQSLLTVQESSES